MLEIPFNIIVNNDLIAINIRGILKLAAKATDRKFGDLSLILTRCFEVYKT